MVWDPGFSSVLLFGGYIASGPSGATFFNDTWSWDGSDWVLLAQDPAFGPRPREGHAMDYDAVRSQLLLFAGYDDGIFLNDTWFLQISSSP